MSLTMAGYEGGKGGICGVQSCTDAFRGKSVFIGNKIGISSYLVKLTNCKLSLRNH